MTRLAPFLALFALTSEVFLLFGAQVAAEEDGAKSSGITTAIAQRVSTTIRGTVTWVDEDQHLLIVQDGVRGTPVRVDLPPRSVQPGEKVVLVGQVSPLVEAFPDYPDRPTGRDICPNFEAPTIGRENYLTRMRGLLHPPVTGTYTFWIASDDSSELLLSSDASPNGAQKIAFVEAGRWTEPRQWDRTTSQKSRAIQLKAGETCYIEAICQQGWGKDCLAVAWQGPGLSREVIDGRYLSPWVQPSELPHDTGVTNGMLCEIWSNFYSGDLAVLKITNDFVVNLHQAQLLDWKMTGLPKPEAVEIGQVLTPEENYRFLTLEGRLSFFSKENGRVELELAKESARVRVHVLGDIPSPPEKSLVRVAGVCEARRDAAGDLVPGNIWVGNTNNVNWLELGENWSPSHSLPMHLLRPSNPELMAGKMIQARGRVVRQESPGVWRLQGEDVFEGYTSADGTNWSPLGAPVELAMNDSAFIGLAVSSRQTNDLAEVKWDHVIGLSEALQGVDIGNATWPGSFEAKEGVFTVRGAGNEMWRSADDFFFACQPMTGEGEVVVRVAGIRADPQAKAGVMIRESLDSQSPWAAVMFTPGGRMGLQSRRETGKNAYGTLFGQPVEWLKLTRHQRNLLVCGGNPVEFQTGKTVDVLGRLSWTNGQPVVTEVHVRRPADSLMGSDTVTEGAKASGGELHNALIGDLLAETDEAQLGGYSARFRIRGVVTFNGQLGGEPLFFIQDSSGVCLVRFRSNVPKERFPVGQVAELTGVVQAATNSVLEFTPHGIAGLGAGELPDPLRYPLDEANSDGRQVGRWMEISGIVRAVEKEGVLSVMTANGVLPVRMGSDLAGQLGKYVNASVRVRGVYWQSPAPMLLLPSEKFIQIVEPSPVDAFAIPAFSIASLRGFNLAPQAAHRMKIAGVVTCLRQNVFFVQDETGGLQIEAANRPNLKVGEMVEAAGFLSRQAFGLVMKEALVRQAGAEKPALPADFSLDEVMEQGNHRLVTLEATLLERHSWRGMQILDLQSGQRAFRALLPMMAGDLPAIANGSRLRLTGVSQVERSPEDVTGGEKPIVATLELLMRRPADVVVLQRPPWWNWKYTAATTGMVAIIFVGALIWIRTLRRRVEQRTAQLRQTMSQLQKETQTSATLAERNRMAGEIHDGLEQGLTAIMMQLDALESKMGAATGEVARHLEFARNMVRFSRTEVRHSLWDWKSPALAEQNLGNALTEIARQMSAGDATQVEVQVSGNAVPLPTIVEHGLLRIAQEALNNALKYAAAGRIHLHLHYGESEIQLTVRDDGRGFDSDSVLSGENGHFGLQNLRGRARKMSGRLIITSRPGGGTVIETSVPFSKTEPADTQKS